MEEEKRQAKNLGKGKLLLSFSSFGEKGGKFVDKTPPAEGRGNELLIFLYCYLFIIARKWKSGIWEMC